MEGAGVGSEVGSPVQEGAGVGSEARRVLGDNNRLTLQMRSTSAAALCNDPGATLEDLREAVTILEDAERIARRVFGAHPVTAGIEEVLESVRAELSAELRGARA